MPRTKLTITTEIDLEIDVAAKWFSGLTDDDMAQFFCAVAKHATEDWPGSPDFMWCHVGKHLAECECATEEGREMVSSIAHHMRYYLDKKELTTFVPGEEG